MRKNRVQSPEAWLVTVTTRLAIDRLRSRKSERETYIDKSWDVGGRVSRPPYRYCRTQSMNA
jgi:DNA-directed RNA polymerase specialized sigma24 family protein